MVYYTTQPIKSKKKQKIATGDSGFGRPATAGDLSIFNNTRGKKKGSGSILTGDLDGVVPGKWEKNVQIDRTFVRVLRTFWHSAKKGILSRLFFIVF